MWTVSILGLVLVTVVCAGPVDNEQFITVPVKPFKTSAQRIEESGYPAESHFVETKDGYVLNLFRIPHSPRLRNEYTEKPVVFIMHGLFSSSDCYLLNGPNDAIAYNFADAGFDVWLGNARGNLYSRNNSKISLKHPNFWKFSWDEIGSIDVPESIDYVLKLTGQKSLHYIGHSQGGTVFYVMTSLYPEYNEKIKSAHLLAPAVFMGNSTSSFITSLGPIIGQPGTTAVRLFENQEFVPNNPVIQNLANVVCGGKPLFPRICLTLWLLWADSAVNLNMTLLPSIAETHPAGISTNQIIHFIQGYVSADFKRYDFGAKGNMQRYQQVDPPSYPLNKVTSDVYIYYGLSDESANPTDMQRLLELLPNVKLFYDVKNPTWGHLDFIFGLKVKSVVNDPVIQNCLQYEQLLNALPTQ